MRKHFLKTAKIALILVYLVIIAGAVVRMTGSGMGCPDWPKCFGYYIPPTKASELQWQAEKEYRQGQVIIIDKTLQVAQNNFTSSFNYKKENWKTYTKHKYAIFNPWHTWIEYINRLLGAIAGLATLLLGILSIGYWKKNKKITFLSWLVVVAMGFQAWLGAVVVYSVLNPFKITIHMAMALVIVAMLMYLISIASTKIKFYKHDKLLSRLLLLALALTMIQVILGTQVRQFIDIQINVLGEEAKNLWLQNPTIQFYVHRSFSICIVILNLFLAFRIYKFNLGYSKINWVIWLLLLEVVTGMMMYYLDFPFSSQPLHLVIASLLFGVQFYLVLETLKPKRNLKSL